MGRDLPRADEADDAGTMGFWKGLVRDLIIAAVIVAVFLGAIYAYAGVWPPLVVVESSSMQHGDLQSNLGVIDTGDMVFQQAAPTRSSVVTYLEARETGYMTYGDFGDVIIFRRAGSSTPVIHRAIMYIHLHANGTADVPDIVRLPTAEWDARNGTAATRDPVFLRTLTVRHMGFEHNINLTFNFPSLLSGLDRTGYLTMGDNNVYQACRLTRDDCTSGYDVLWLARVVDVQGRARGEIPWLGLIKLTLQPSDSCCPGGWGDPEAPRNSWDSLLVSLIFLLALPFILEYAGRGWMKYVSPRLPKIRWPWRPKDHGSKEPPGKPGSDLDGGEPPMTDRRPPREGSSEP